RHRSGCPGSGRLSHALVPALRHFTSGDCTSAWAISHNSKRRMARVRLGDSLTAIFTSGG
ncbi:MAG TPA: hypothetical protein VNB87_16085, partial [Propionibacteriaceae bacterium]|nr:hypothetical protein [Propionibacteriaceae bacterium]